MGVSKYGGVPMKKTLRMFSAFVSTSLLLVGAVNPIFAQESSSEAESAQEESAEESGEESSDAEDADASEGSDSSEEEAAEESEEETEAEGSEEESASEKFDFEYDIEAALKESTQAEISELFTSLEGLEAYNQDGISYKIDGYKLYELKNISRDWDTVFDKQRERGGMLVVQITYTNDTDKPIFIGQSSKYSVIGADRSYSHSSQFIPDEEALTNKIIALENVLPAGESITGYETVALPADVLDHVLENGEITYKPGYISLDETDEDNSKWVSMPEQVVLPLSEDNMEKQAAKGEFYPDKFITDNLGTKEMLEEGEVNETLTVEDVDVTVNGYQITEFTPNKEEAPKYANFKDGVVVYTVEYTIENNSSQEEDQVKFMNTNGNLILNESIQYDQQSTFVPEVVPDDTVLAEGDSATGYLVFTISKDDYEIYKGRSIMVDVNVYDKDFRTMNDYQTLIFTLKAAE